MSKPSPEIMSTVDRYLEAMLAYVLERSCGDEIWAPLTAEERELVKGAEKTIQKAVLTIELELEKLDVLPPHARGAIARAVLHEAYVIAGFRSGLPLVRRPGRESIHEVVNRFCYRPRRKT